MGRVLKVKFGSGEERVRTPGPPRFGEAVIDLTTREIRAGGRAVRIEPRAAAVLAEIINHAGQVVSREMLLDACWPAGEGSDEALTQAVAQLRRALGDTVKAPAYIATVSKTGYRWVAAKTAGERGGQAGAQAPARRFWAPGRIAAAGAAALALVGVGVVAGGVAAPKPKPRMVVTQEVYFNGKGPPPPLPELKPLGADLDTTVRVVRLSPPTPPRTGSALPRNP